MLLIDLSIIEEPHSAEVSGHVALFMTKPDAPLHIQAREEGPVVGERLEVEPVEIQETIADVVENATPLTHDSNLGNFAINYRTSF